MATNPIENQKILVTGATGGIGQITALELARKGAHVIIVGRNPSKTEKTAHDLRQASGNPRVDYLVADLSVQAEVRRLAAEYQRRYDQLHVLVNNAGGFFAQRELTADGSEMSLALNHLAPFLLTQLLMDPLTRSAPARIVTVSSMAHQPFSLDFEDMDSSQAYSGWRAYGRSKLMNIYFTYALARRLDPAQVTANCLHPGFVNTGFGKGTPGLLGALMRAALIFSISPRAGAQTSIYLASDPAVAAASGGYYVQKKAVRSSAVSYDEAAGERLWQYSLERTGLA